MTNKDEQLIFRFFECKKNYKKDFKKSYLIDFEAHMSFAMKTLINLFCY